MLTEMHNVLLHLALLTVRAHSLVVGTVLFPVPLYVHRSYVDDGSFVVFIVDTTRSLSTSGVEGKRLLRCRLGRGADY